MISNIYHIRGGTREMGPFLRENSHSNEGKSNFFTTVFVIPKLLNGLNMKDTIFHSH